MKRFLIGLGLCMVLVPLAFAQKRDVRIANVTTRFLRQDGNLVAFALKFDVANYSDESVTFLNLEALDVRGHVVTRETIKHTVAARSRSFVYQQSWMSADHWKRTRMWILVYTN